MCMWVSVDVGSLDMLNYITVKGKVFFDGTHGNFEAKTKTERQIGVIKGE